MSASRLNHGGPAFPMPGADYTEDCGDFKRDAYHGPQQGMTLRDYFAAKAMVGLCHFWVQVRAKTTINDPEPEIIARMAYEYADAMLKARAS
jgi:hypothetical protein